MQWNNELQKEIVMEYLEHLKDGVSPSQAKKDTARKYGLSVYVVSGLVELHATEGLSKVKSAKTDGHRFEPVNYRELVGDLKERVEALERKFNFLLDGVERVLEDGETMRAHVQQLRSMSRWMQRKESFDIEPKVIGLKGKEDQG